MKTNKTYDLERLVPPGISPSNQLHLFFTANVISLIISLSFFVSYYRRYEDLFRWHYGEKELISGAVMPDFPLVLGSSTVGFFLTALFMLAFVIYHYGSYKNGSMSVYLMKRLPKGSEMHLRAWALPLITSLLSLLMGFLVSVIYLGFYLLVTPQECLNPNQWLSFWSFFSYFN